MRSTWMLFALTVGCREDTATRATPPADPPIAEEPSAAARATTAPKRSEAAATERPEADVPAATVQDLRGVGALLRF